MGKSKSQSYPNGLRKIEKSTGKKLAPKSLRDRHKYLSDCTEEELAAIGVVRFHATEVGQQS